MDVSDERMIHGVTRCRDRQQCGIGIVEVMWRACAVTRSTCRKIMGSRKQDTRRSSGIETSEKRIDSGAMTKKDFIKQRQNWGRCERARGAARQRALIASNTRRGGKRRHALIA
mmetsp:Transcript_88245/g.248419  ORF Transcript_88245/g.248419 Transcript_88245/m.248419 type:complete len:114 (-) Transcript_88245:622-963(-)